MNNRLITSFIRLWNTRDELSVKNIRLEHWQYFLAFPIIMVINNISGGFFHYNITPFGIGLFTFLFGAMEVAALLTVVSPVRYLKTYVVIWPLCLAIGLFACLLLPEGPVWLLFAVCYWAGLGGCAVCAFYAYVFISRNAERFLGILLIAVALGVDVFLYKSDNISVFIKNIMLTILVLTVTACFLRFNPLHSFLQNDKKEKNSVPFSAYSILICVIVFSAIVIFGDCGMLSVVEKGSDNHLLFGVGNIIAAIVAIILHVVFHRSIWHAWNLFLGGSIAGLGIIMIKNSDTISYGAFLYGFARGMGNISLFYLGGGLLKKYFSVSLCRRSIFCFAFLMALFNTVSQIMYVHIPELVIYTAFFVSITLTVICMLASPLFFQHVFFTEWMDEYHSVDMTIGSKQLEKIDKFENLSLTPREKEVCLQLLEGFTLRRISDELGISYSTVNSHYKNLYRKLGVNSRTELILKFGVESLVTKK